MQAEKTVEIGFILTQGYALMSAVSAVEPLRAANDLAGRMLYRPRFFSVGGGFVGTTAGGGFPTENLLESFAAPDVVFVVAGGNPMLYEDKLLERGLRAMARRGAKLGGISGGAAILAKAGFMEGRRFTVHWAHIDPLSEYDPDLLIERALYVIDRDRYTCAGGVAALDMMGAIIASHHGATFARKVGDWFIHSRLRLADEPQQASARDRFNLHHPILAAAVDLMTSHIADPLSPDQLAALAGSSARQLQRLFSAQFGKSMMEFYRDLRLAKADELVQQTALPVVEIALLTGFSGAAHLTRLFSEKYGLPPGKRRKKAGAADRQDPAAPVEPQ